jgi:hypothetical protein
MTKRHSRHEPSPGDVSVRSDGDAAGGDEMYSIRLPISSTAVARDGDAFSADRLRGFADQIEGRTVPVFLSHGRSGLSAERYGALGKVGRVANPALEERDGVTTLDADLLIADPDSLAESGDTGDVEAALRWVREQAKRGLVATSVGWNEDVGGRDVAGDAELLEVSIVGIASDTEAVQRSAEPSDAVERGLNGLPSPSTSRASSRTGFDALARKARDDPPTAVREHPTDDRTSHPEVETEEHAGESPSTAAACQYYLLAYPERPLTDDEVDRLRAVVDDAGTVEPEYVALFDVGLPGSAYKNADRQFRRLLLEDPKHDTGAEIADRRFWSSREVGSIGALDGATRSAIRRRAEDRTPIGSTDSPARGEADV